MPRYRLTVAYDGTDFCGWQRQCPPDGPELRTVQLAVMEAVQHVVREPVEVLGASRTDSGVHARGQVAAFTCEAERDPERMRRAIDSRLPDDVRVVSAELTRETFDPIADATSKGYSYTLAYATADGTPRPLFDRRYVARTAYRLDPAHMHHAAQALIGEHDFASFAALHHGRKSTVRTIFDCGVRPVGPHRLRIDVSGNGFLYNMVRIIAGTLIEVGRGKIAPADMPDILTAADRTSAGPTAPPEGLCLEWIDYR